MQNYSNKQFINEACQVKISGNSFCRIELLKRQFRALKVTTSQTHLYYLHLADVEPNGTMSKGINEALKDAKQKAGLIESGYMRINMGVGHDNYNGIYLHPLVAQMYFQTTDKDLKALTSQLMIQLMYHQDEQFRQRIKEETDVASITLQQNHILIAKYLPEVNQARMETIITIAMRCYNQKANMCDKSLMRSFIFDDAFYFEMLRDICDNIQVEGIDDELVKIFIIQRLEMVKIIFNNEGDQELQKSLVDYLEQEMNRLQDGVMPHYVKDFLMANEDLKYIGSCKKYLSPKDRIFELELDKKTNNLTKK